jgi:CxxC motif-containing protein (DUF1111 family)
MKLIGSRLLRGIELALALGLMGCGGGGPVTTLQIGAVVPGALEQGDSLPGLTADQQAAFEEGRTEFAAVESVTDGLGPVFNGNSCGACHSQPAMGGSGSTLDTRIGTLIDGTFNGLANLGGSLLQAQGIGAVNGCDVHGETVPPAATIVALRRPPPLFGMGLVDATPDQTFLDLAASQVGDPDGVSGRVNSVADLVNGGTSVGRFGWKAATPNLTQQAAAAYNNEMGITTSLFPADPCPQGDCSQQGCDGVPGIEDDGSGVNAFATFIQFLAPPPVPKLTGETQAGFNSFVHIGCATCHVPSLTTGPNGIAALDQVSYAPYSDFLLHDMGALGDGIVQGQATGTEMRTAPLWGVSSQPFFLHDGRATTLADAILAHDGEAKPARDRFAGLDDHNRQKIVAFLNAL